MNNREWLYSLDVADLSDWFDAEHVENQERALDGDTDALEAKCSKLYDELDAAYAKNRSLRQHISQMQNGRNEWHVKAVRLEKQLEVTNKRCEEYRSKFGRCLDYADAIHALMDDEGMA